MAKKATSAFSIKLVLGDKTYTSKGTTAFDALSALQKPEKIMAKGVLTLTHGTISKTILMYPPRLKRLFYGSDLFKEIQAKSLRLGLK